MQKKGVSAISKGRFQLINFTKPHLFFFLKVNQKKNKIETINQERVTPATRGWGG